MRQDEERRQEKEEKKITRQSIPNPAPFKYLKTTLVYCIKGAGLLLAEKNEIIISTLG